MELVLSMQTVSVASKEKDFNDEVVEYLDEFSCSIGFNGNRCENDLCQRLNCQNNGECYIRDSQAFCR